MPPNNAIPAERTMPAAKQVVERLRKAGHEALFAGGCVRDIILGRTPSDFDVATSARPEDVKGLFLKTIPVGESFGVILVILGDISVEVATFRADGCYLDGRHPASVSFSNIQGDAARRDFTINSMFLDPLSGTVTDLFDGKKDLESGIIRTVGDPDTRFAEDHLRMLRAVRFAVQLGFVLDEQTEFSIRRNAKHIRSVSPERTGEEVSKIMLSSNRAKGLAIMDSMDLLQHILPEVSAMKGVKQSPVLHPEGDVFEHTLLCLEKLGQAELKIAMSVLLHDIGKTCTLDNSRSFYGHETRGARMAVEICRRLRFRNDEIEAIEWAIARHLVFKDIKKMKDSTLRRLLGHDHFSVLLELGRTDAAASTGDMSFYEFARDRMRAYEKEPVLPAPLLRGDDLLAMGMTAGPALGDLLERIYDAQLEGLITDRDGALTMARRIHGTSNSH